MENLLNIFVRSIFIDNMIFAYFLGMCSYLAVSKTVKTLSVWESLLFSYCSSPFRSIIC